MGLLHWWTLNNTLEDKTGKLPLIAWHAPSFDVGKVTASSGKTTRGSSNDSEKNFYRAVDFTSVSTSLSVSFWMIIDSNLTSGYCSPFLIGAWSAYEWWAVRFGIVYYYNSNKLVFAIADGASYALADSSSTNTTLSRHTWYHITAVYNYKNSISLYVNGQKVAETTTTLVPTLTGYYCIGGNSTQYYAFNGLINDIRVYDEALSDYEIKELARGLCLHYTVPYSTNLLAKSKRVISGDNASGITSSYGETELTVVAESGNGNWKSCIFDDSTTTNTNFETYMTSGTKYTLSFDVKIVSGNGLPNVFINRHNDYKAVTGNRNLIGQWQRVYVTYTYGGYDDTAYGWIKLHLGFEGLAGTWQFKNFKIELGQNENTAWTPALTDINVEDTIYDSAGYKNTGVPENTLKVKDTESKSNFYAIKFNGTNSVIAGNALPAEAKTLSMWVKGTIPTSNTVLFADNVSKLGFGFYNKNGLGLIISASGDNDGKPVYSLTNYKEDDWNHIVVVKDCDCWINGQKLTRRGDENYWTHVGDKLTIGCRNDYNGSYNSFYDGLISDVRVYSTALSETDIISLYTNSGLITNKQELFSNYIIENDNAIEAPIKGKRLSIEAKNVYEGSLEYFDTLLYKQIEYIESTGTQYIDTGYYPKLNKTKIVADAEKEVSKSIFGAGANIFTFTGGATDHYAYYGEQSVVHTNVAYADRHLYIMDKNHVYIDSTAYGNLTLSDTTSSLSLYIFGRNVGNNLSDAGTHKLYGLKIFEDNESEDNELLYNFIPVIRKVDQKPGLYDLVEHKFYTNKGTGEFLANGIDTSQYKQIEYIESTGTQYIDTGIPAAPTNKYELKISKQTESGGTMGSDNSWGGFLMYNSNRDGYRFHVPHYLYDVNNIYDYILNITCLTDGLTVNNRGGEETDDTNNYSGNIKIWPKYSGSYNRGKCKLYSCKIYSNNTLVRDFIPVVRTYDNKPGLYDRVNHSFYVNLGTGEFITPNELPFIYERRNYIESNGTQYIDTGVAVTKGNTNRQTEITFEYTEENNSGPSYDAIYGVNSNMQLGRTIGSGNFTDGKNNGNSPIVLALKTVYTYRCDYSNGNSYVNGEWADYRTLGTAVSSGNAYLFACRASNSDSPNYLSKARVYSCRIWEEGQLIRDFVPCYRISDNEAGLYDMVNAKFYTKAVGDAFTCSNEFPVQSAKTTSEKVKIYNDIVLVNKIGEY